MAVLTMESLAVGKPSWYLGARVDSATAITPVITSNYTSGNVPCQVQVSIQGTTVTGDSKYYGHIEVSWDFGDTGDTRTANNEFGKSVNLNNGQVGREAAYVYMKPGSYTITANYRIWNGVSLITATQTLSFTVNPIPSNALRMYISTSGSDSNDGNDPNGFALTGATWTASTKTLTKAGAFTSYNHATATAPTYDLQKTNIIYISGGTGGVVTGWYTIESKTNNDSIVLTSRLTANDVTNGTNITSSNGPKATVADTSTALKTFIEADTGVVRYGFIRAGDTHSIRSAMTGERSSGRRIISYGANSNVTKVTFIANASLSGNPMFFVNDSTGTSGYGDWLFCGIKINLNSVSSVHYFTLYFGPASTSSGSAKRYCWVDCEFNNGISSDGLPVFNMNRFGTSVVESFMWINCSFSNPLITKSHLFIMGDRWLTFIGCNFTGGNGNPTFDHYIYPDKWENRLFAYCNFATLNNKLSYAINNNVEDAAGADKSYMDIRNNVFYGPNYAVDLSNDNNGLGGGNCNNAFFGDNLLNGVTKGIYCYNVKTLYVARNRYYSSNTSPLGNVLALIWINNSIALDIEVWDNKIYFLNPGVDSYGVFACAPPNAVGHIAGNYLRISGTSGAYGGENYSSSNIAWDKNNFSRTTGSVFFYDSFIISGNVSGTTTKTLAQWQAVGNDTDLSNSNPGWIDPTNNIFSGGILTLSNTSGIIVSLDSGTINLSAVNQSSISIDTYRLYNSGDYVLVIDANGIVISGSGSGTIPGSVTLYPGDYVTVPITKTTSSAGAKSYTITATHNSAGSPFTVTVNFTVNSGGSPGNTIFNSTRDGNPYYIFNQ